MSTDLTAEAGVSISVKNRSGHVTFGTNLNARMLLNTAEDLSAAVRTVVIYIEPKPTVIDSDFYRYQGGMASVSEHSYINLDFGFALFDS